MSSCYSLNIVDFDKNLDNNYQNVATNVYEARVIGISGKDTYKIEFQQAIPQNIKRIESIRLIGIDTPNLSKVYNQYSTEDFYSKEAYTKLQSLMNKNVKIVFDKELMFTRDLYGNLYAYVYIKEVHEESFNEELILEGYARYWNSNLPIEEKIKELFKDSELYAQYQQKGVWRGFLQNSF